MRADPFDLSTWYHRPMSKENLAADFVTARIRFAKARGRAQEASMQREMREAGVKRLSAELDALITRHGEGEPSKACSTAALKLAEGVALWRASERVAQDAEDHLTASQKETERAFEALIAAAEPISGS